MGQLMITAMASGEGKTLVTSGLLALAKLRGISADSRKCGPDYIDPMFHRKVLGLPSDNLDSFLMGEERVHRSLSLKKADLRLIEGAMGYYDGIGGGCSGSAWEIAAREGIPAVLVVRPRGNSSTLAAQIRGLLSFREPSMIRGILINDCRESMYLHLKPILERELSLPVAGYLPHMKGAVLESRHLGLVTPDEVESLGERLADVARQMEMTVDFSRLLEIAEESENLIAEESENLIAEEGENLITEESGNLIAEEGENLIASKSAYLTASENGNRIASERAHRGDSTKRCLIAAARDEAFCFYYEGSLRALKEHGAELRWFSPLHDRKLPGADALILPGGYPELHAKTLSENETMRNSIRDAVRCGMPTLAECGGFLYLLDELEDEEGRKWPMAGVLPGAGYRTGGLVRFGYCYLTAGEDSMLFRAGEKVPAHEFHHCDATVCGEALRAEKPSFSKSWRCGYADRNIYAGFPHLHLGGEIPLAERFVKAACEYKSSGKGAHPEPPEDASRYKETGEDPDTETGCLAGSGDRPTESSGRGRLPGTTGRPTESSGRGRPTGIPARERDLYDRVEAIAPLDKEAMERAQSVWDSLAKPVGSLGEMESHIIQIAGIQRSEKIRLDRRELLVLCADNGVVREGVSQSGQDVTAAVARALIRGRSSANVLSRGANCKVFPVDIGMAEPLNLKELSRSEEEAAKYCVRREDEDGAAKCCVRREGEEKDEAAKYCVRRGTEDITRMPAMTREECVRAILIGIDLVRERRAAGADILLTGEMGIGNTTTSAAVTSVLLGCGVSAVTGRGAGLTDAGLTRKIRAIETAVRVNCPDPSDVIDVLAKVGGLDIAGLCGICLGGALFRVPILLDGVITLAAALCAVRLRPSCRDFLLPAHLPIEPAGEALIKELELHPPLRASLRLGEGTGALMALPVYDQALALYRGGSSFHDLGIEPYKRLMPRK